MTCGAARLTLPLCAACQPLRWRRTVVGEHCCVPKHPHCCRLCTVSFCGWAVCYRARMGALFRECRRDMTIVALSWDGVFPPVCSAAEVKAVLAYLYEQADAAARAKIELTPQEARCVQSC